MTKFTGGDDLTGFPKVIHDILMKNELKNGEGAYELSHANTGASGYSFGGNQMDLLHNSTARTALEDILSHHTIDQNIINDVLGTVQQANGILSDNYIGIINSALQSDYGIKKINSVYQTEIDILINDVNNRVSTALPEVRDVINTSDYVKAFLCDYHNQFYIKENGLMHKFLEGDSNVTLFGGTPDKIDVDLLKNTPIEERDDLLIDMLKGFVYKTKYYSEPTSDQAKKQADIKRRHSNVKKESDKVKLKKSEENVKDFIDEYNEDITAPILPDPAKKYTVEDILLISEQAVGQHSSARNIDEYEGMVSETGNMHYAVSAALIYANAVKSYGFGLANDLKEREQDYQNVLAENNGNLNHPDVIEASQYLLDTAREHKEFQDTVETAAVWANFTVGMASAIARASGNPEEARNIDFYGNTLINGALSAAQIYAGNPMGFVGLTNSVMALAGGPPKEDPQIKMLKKIYEGIIQIKQDLQYIKSAIHQLSMAIAIVNKNILIIDKKVDMLAKQLDIVTKISLEIAEKVEKIEKITEIIRYEQYMQGLEQNANLTGFNDVKLALIHKKKLDPENNAERYNDHVNLFIQSISCGPLALSVSSSVTLARLAEDLNLKSNVDLNSALNHGLSYTSYLLFKLAEQLTGYKFNITRSGNNLETTNYSIACLAMWGDGVSVRIALFRELQRQRKLIPFLEYVGYDFAINELMGDIKLAENTLAQYDLLGKSSFIDKLNDSVISQIAEFLNTYKNNRKSISDDDISDNQYKVISYQLSQYRETIIRSEQKDDKLSTIFPKRANFDDWRQEEFIVNLSNSTTVETDITHYTDIMSDRAIIHAEMEVVNDPRWTDINKTRITKQNIFKYNTNFFNNSGGYPDQFGFSCHFDAGTRVMSHEIIPTRLRAKIKIWHVSIEAWNKALFENCVRLKGEKSITLASSVTRTYFEKIRNESSLIKQLVSNLDRYRLIMKAMVDFYISKPDPSDTSDLRVNAANKLYEAIDTLTETALITVMTNAVTWTAISWTTANPDFNEVDKAVLQVQQNILKSFDRYGYSFAQFKASKLSKNIQFLIDKLRMMSLMIKSLEVQSSNPAISVVLKWLDDIKQPHSPSFSYEVVNLPSYVLPSRPTAYDVPSYKYFPPHPTALLAQAYPGLIFTERYCRIVNELALAEGYGAAFIDTAYQPPTDNMTPNNMDHPDFANGLYIKLLFLHPELVQRVTLNVDGYTRFNDFNLYVDTYKYLTDQANKAGYLGAYPIYIDAARGDNGEIIPNSLIRSIDVVYIGNKSLHNSLIVLETAKIVDIAAATASIHPPSHSTSASDIIVTPYTVDQLKKPNNIGILFRALADYLEVTGRKNDTFFLPTGKYTNDSIEFLAIKRVSLEPKAVPLIRHLREATSKPSMFSAVTWSPTRDRTPNHNPTTSSSTNLSASTNPNVGMSPITTKRESKDKQSASQFFGRKDSQEAEKSKILSLRME